MGTEDLNPYASPSLGGDDVEEPVIVPGADLRVRCQRKSWLSRELELSGRIDAAIRYDGMGRGEKVFVNDTLVATSSVWHFTIVAPHIDFEIHSGGEIFPATIRVYAAWLQLGRVIRFSLEVDRQLLYSEPAGR